MVVEYALRTVCSVSHVTNNRADWQYATSGKQKLVSNMATWDFSDLESDGKEENQA